MKIVNFTMKYGRWLPFLAAYTLFGCASVPQPPQSTVPREHAKDAVNYQAGDSVAITGNLANFGEAPKAMNPLSLDSARPASPGTRISPPSAPETPAPKTPPSSSPPLPLDKPDSGQVAKQVTMKVARDYDFSLKDIKIAPPSKSVAPTYDITAFNNGNAPVSVAVGIDKKASRNIATDKTLPLNAVVPPNTERTVVQVKPRTKNEAYNLSYIYSWSIGDYTARHDCPEHYRFPFGDKVRAFAGVSDRANATPFTRHAVVFSMPAGTPVLAARKGTVVQVRGNDRVDILHDDATIATYSHLGKIADGMEAGKAVTTEDIIGTAGGAENHPGAYLQLTVWRPEPPPVASLKTSAPGPGFELVSFPLEFCGANPNDCGALTHNQAVARTKGPEKMKPANHTVKRATRKAGSR